MLVAFPLLATDLDCPANLREPAQRQRTERKHIRKRDLTGLAAFKAN